MHSNSVPIFFATDDNYAPYLAVSIASLLSNASKEYIYDIHILTSQMSDDNRLRISAIATDNSKIVFDDVGEKMRAIADKISLRDYYSVATYYRIFIAEMFPEYDKAIYIDSDTVILGDISVMYNTDIGDHLVGAIQDDVMLIDIFGRYSEVVLGIDSNKYFNAGVLLMNLKLFRSTDMEGRFLSLISKRRFPVAQDQDCLNLLCKDLVYYFTFEWNLDPIDLFKDRSPSIIHYKMHRRPWHYDGVLFGEHFWDYTHMSGYHDDILRLKSERTEADARNDAAVFDGLVCLAEKEISNVESGKVPCASIYCPPV